MAISSERREQLRKIAKDRVADLNENPEFYGLGAEKKKLRTREQAPQGWHNAIAAAFVKIRPH